MIAAAGRLAPPCRAALGLAGARASLVAFAMPQVADQLRASPGRAWTPRRATAPGSSTGLRIAPTTRARGVGAGGFKRAYADRVGLRGRDRRRPHPIRPLSPLPRRAGVPGSPCSLARGRGARHRLPRPRPRSMPAPRARRWAYARRDRRAQPLLQRALRGPDDLGAARPRRARRSAPAGPEETRMIRAWKRVARARAAHRRRRVRLRRHDGAARRGGLEVRYVAFSIATRRCRTGSRPTRWRARCARRRPSSASRRRT